MDEFSAMVDKKTLVQMYDIATKDKYNFLYINLLANDVDNMFFWNFDKRLVPSSIEEGWHVLGNNTCEGANPSR